MENTLTQFMKMSIINQKITNASIKNLAQKSKKQEIVKGKVIVNHPPVQHLPYPHAPPKEDKERQQKRFLDIFKRLQINIPFSEVNYSMKDLLTMKRRIMDDEIVELEAGCSQLFKNPFQRNQEIPVVSQFL